MNGPSFAETPLPIIESKSQAKIQKPRRYKVFLNNDDYTPMEFVVKVLRKFFHFDEASAIQLMLEVHFKGRALCGVFTYEIAETKVALVNAFARENEYPLLCTMEPE